MISPLLLARLGLRWFGRTFLRLGRNPQVWIVAVGLLLGQVSSLAADIAPGTLPNGAQIVAGTGSIAQNGNVLVVQQDSAKLVTNWAGFGIGSAASVQFRQPGADSIALNRVTGGNPSQILGSLEANGRVFLLNPAGIVFGKTANVNVGGLVASTLSLSDADFLAGRHTFANSGAAGSIVNQGTIAAAPGGVVALLAPVIRNEGTLAAPGGDVALAAGDQVDVDFAGDGRLRIRIDLSAVDAEVANHGLIKADGGAVVMSAKSASNLTRAVVNNTGIVEANTVASKNGRIVLESLGAGSVQNSGTLSAQGLAAGETGGAIVVTGERVGLMGSAVVDASGQAGGGTVFVGGSWQNSDPSVRQATSTVIESGAALVANATDRGHGGTVVAWSDITNPGSVTRAHGTFEANGGPNGGDGGRIETSGHWLDATGAKGSASASNGNAGEWLFDPYNVTITGATANGSFSSGVWTPAGNNSTVLNTTINSLLETGTSVTITTGASGTQMGDISVDAAITKSTGNADVTLTLNAANSIAVNQAIANTGGTGRLNVVLDADNDAGIGNGAGIVMLDSDISTNGGALRFGTGRTAVVNGITTLVGGDVYVAGTGARTISTAGGAVDVRGEMIVANTNGLTINSGGGNVHFYGLLNSGNQYDFVAGAQGTGSWSAAVTAAKSGTGGAIGDTYLVTITSRLENAVAMRSANYQGSWMGAHRDTSNGTGYTWRWVTGSEGLEEGGAGRAIFEQNPSGGGTVIGGHYVNWDTSNSANEPNGTGPSGEQCGQFMGAIANWNDLGDNVTYNDPNMTAQYRVMGYVKETNLSLSPVTIQAGAGTVTFDSAVGGNKALRSLTVDAATTVLNGGSVTTDSLSGAGAQSYSGNVALGSASTVLTMRDTSTAFTVASGKSIANATGSDASLTIKTTANIVMQTGSGISSPTGKLNTVLWADSDANGGGVLLHNNASVSTNGGHLWLGGGSGSSSWHGLAVGDGYAQGANFGLGNTDLDLHGILLGTTSASGVSLSTAGGDVAMYGKSALVGTGNKFGVGVYGGTTIDSGSGKILITGISQGTSSDASWRNGVEIGPNATSGSLITSASTASDAITITGDASTADSSSGGIIGILLNVDNTVSATAGGGISLTGQSNASGTSATKHDVLFGDGASVLANSGAIAVTAKTVLGISGAGDLAIGYRAGSAVTASTSAITMTTDALGLATTDRIQSAGALTVVPYNAGTTVGIAGGAGTLSLPASYFSTNFADGFSGITIGNATAGAITVGGATTFRDSTTLRNASTIALNGALNANANLTLSGNGAITQSAALSVAGTTSLTAGSGNAISLAATGNDFTGAVTIVSGHNVSLTDTNALTLGTSTVSGNLAVQTGGALTQAGALAVTGTTSLTAGASDITLSQGGNNFIGAVTIVSGNNVSLTDANSLRFGGASTFTGNLNVAAADFVQAAGATITGGAGAITITADTIALDGAADSISGTGSLFLYPVTLTRPIKLGAAGSAADFALDATELATLKDGFLAINLGRANLTGGIDLSGALSFKDNTFIDNRGVGGRITLAADAAVTTNGSQLYFLAGTGDSGAFIQNPGATINSGAGYLQISADSIMLGGAVDSIRGTGIVSLQPNTDTRPVILGAAGGAGDFTLTTSEIATLKDGFSGIWLGADSNNGGMTIASALAFHDSLLLFQKVAGGSYTVNATPTVAGILNFARTAPVTLNASVAGSSGVTFSGAVTVGANGLTVDAGTGAGTFSSTVTHGANNFTVTANDVALLGNWTGTGARLLQPTTVGQSIGLAGGAGAFALSTVELGYLANGLPSSVTIGRSGGTGAITGSTFSFDDPLFLRGGAISQAGMWTLGSTASFAAGTGDITLTQATNHFIGAVTIVSGHNVSLTDTNALDLGASTVSGNLTVQTGGDLTQSGDLAITGATSLTAGANNATLDRSGNDFGGAVSIVSGNNVSLRDTNALVLGASTVTDNLTLQTGGALTQTGNLTVTGTTSITAGANDVTLDRSGNNFVGAVSIISGNNVSVRDSNDLTLGAVTATGTVDIATLTGDLTLSGAIETDDDTAAAITLNAGTSAAAGTAAGGNLIVSGGSLATGAGGFATLYTGSLSGSTGLTALVGSGTGRFRYNSDESTTNYSTALTAGFNAIYREQPILSVTPDSRAITYGDATPAFTPTIGTDYVNGDASAGTITGTATWTSGGATSTAGHLVVGNHEVGYDSGLVSSLGYGFTDNATSFNELAIAQKSLAVTGLTVANKTYDATNVATLGGTATITVLGSDDVTLGGTASGTFADKNFGSGKAVTVTGNTISGDDAANYTLVQQTGLTADIAKANLAVTGLTAANKTYDATNVATLGGTATITVLGSDDVNLGGTASGTFADKNFGSSKAVTVTGNTISGDDAANYTLVQQTGLTADISAKTLTATYTASNKVYDGTTSATIAGPVLTGLVGTETVSATNTAAAFDNKNVGTAKTVTVSGIALSDGTNGGLAANYTIASTATTTAAITPATLTYVADPVEAYSPVALPVLSGAVTGFIGTDTLANATTGTAAWTSNVTPYSFTGHYAITGSGLAAGNYVFVQAAGNAAALTFQRVNPTAADTPRIEPFIRIDGRNLGEIYPFEGGSIGIERSALFAPLTAPAFELIDREDTTEEPPAALAPGATPVTTDQNTTRSASPATDHPASSPVAALTASGSAMRSAF